MTLVEAVLAALVAIATRGECYEAARYPADQASDITGYVNVDGCAIPTTPELSREALCSIALQLADPTGQGRGINCR